MATNTRTPAEQTEWDVLFRELVVDCVRRQGFKKALACLSLARDVADAALVQRSQSIEESKR